MAGTDPPPERPPRTMSRAARRAQIIEATIATLAERGFARTTLTAVARRAAMSHGLVLFHFETKDRLLAETLGHLAEEYRHNWQRALDAAGTAPAAQLAAMIEADFAPEICTPARLAAWCAFWGEAQSRPLYQQVCGAKDAHYAQTLEEICARLIREGGYRRDPVIAARVLRVTVEGVWLDLMTSARPYSIAAALATVRSAVAWCFPQDFA